MNKIFWTVVVIVAVYLLGLWMTRSTPPAQALDVPTRQPVTSTPPACRAAAQAWRPTETPIPTATTGYQETAIVAQATADEARRVNVMVTAAFEQRALARLQMTAQFEQRVQEIYSWTATAAATSVPLTATQQAALNTQIPMRSTLESAYLTATHQAPTQEVAMQQAIYFRKYGAVDYFARWFFVVVIGGFLLGLLAWILRNPVLPKPALKEQPEGTVIWLKNEKDKGASSTRYAVPCSPEQLTELSELVVNGEKTFGINRLENNSRTLRRSVLYQVREFLTLNEFAVDAGAGQIALNEAGAEFLTAWFDEHQLPGGYSFAEAEVVDETA